MAKQTVNLGSSANDGTGDPLRTAFTKINENFDELYGASAFGQQVTISGNQITANESNADLVLSGSGTGGVVASAIRITGTSLVSDDSTQIQINENLDVGGNITASGNITATGNIFANGNINLGNAASDQTKVVGVFEADNIQIDGTTITTNTTNGSLQIIGNGSGAVDIETLQIQNSTISPVTTNGDLTLSPNGTGNVVVGALTLNGTAISAADSSLIQLNEAVNVSGALAANTSLSIAGDGATVTGIKDEDNMASDSAVKLATQQSIKAYADTKATLTGSTNNQVTTVTGANAVQGESNLTFDGSTLAVTGAATVSTTLNVSGASTLAGGATVNGLLTAGSVTTNQITTNGSDADFTISTQGTGNLILGPITVQVTDTGTQIVSNDSSAISFGEAVDVNAALSATSATIGALTVTGQAEFEALRLRDNTIEGTRSNEDITINPAGTGKVAISRNLDVGTEIETPKITRTGDFNIDASGDIILDADGGDIFLRDGAAGNFGVFIRSGSNDLTIQSGSSQSIIFSGANSALQGALSVSGSTTLNGATSVSGDLTATGVITNTITSNGSNAQLSIQPSGTGDVLISALRVNGTTLDSSDSTKITIAENLDVTGDVVLQGNLTVNATDSVLTAREITAPVVNGNIGRFDRIDNQTTNGDILVNTQGTGKVDFQTGKQSTVGTAGTASALPGQPEGYLIIKVDGVSRVLPFYKQS